MLATYTDVTATNAATFFIGNYSNVLHIGKDGGNAPTGIFSPEEAWNIDTKLDDGKPAFGRVVTTNKNNATDCTTSVTEAVSEYNLASTSNTACILLMKML